MASGSLCSLAYLRVPAGGSGGCACGVLVVVCEGSCIFGGHIPPPGGADSRGALPRTKAPEGRGPGTQSIPSRSSPGCTASAPASRISVSIPADPLAVLQPADLGPVQAGPRRELLLGQAFPPSDPT